MSITIDNNFLESLGIYPSTSSEKKEAPSEVKTSNASKNRAKGIDDIKISNSSNNSEGKNAAKLILQALELIQELEVLLTLFHSKDASNQSKISTALETVAQNQANLQEVQEKQMDVLRHEAKEKAKAMKIVSIVIGAISIVAAAFMGPGALLVASAMFAAQESGGLNKLTAHMNGGEKLGLTIGIALAGAAAGAGIDGAVGSALNSAAEAGADAAAGAGARDVAEEESFSVSKQMASSFRSVGYGTFAQALGTINPTQDLLEKLGMSKKDAAILAGIINTLIALVALLKAGKASSNVFEKNPEAGGLLGKMFRTLFNSAEAQRLTAGVQGGTGIAQSVLGFQTMNIYKEMAKFEKGLASTNSLLYLIHEMMQNVGSLTQMSSQTATSLQKSFGNEMQALGTLPMAYESAARVLTNSAA